MPGDNKTFLSIADDTILKESSPKKDSVQSMSY